MNAEAAGGRAVASYEIDDIFLIASSCTSGPEFNPTQQIVEVSVRLNFGIASNVRLQRRTPLHGGADILVIRYIATGELLILSPGVPEDKVELDPADTLANVQLTFAADYRCSEADFSDREAIGSFVRYVRLHVWPYWREGVSEILTKMRLPRVTIPMMKPTDLEGSGENSKSQATS